jgi:hypothetical protein
MTQRMWNLVSHANPHGFILNQAKLNPGETIPDGQWHNAWFPTRLGALSNSIESG